MRGRRQPPPRHSGRKAVNPGSARAEPSHPSKLGFQFHFSFGRRGLRAPASGAAFEDMAVMEQTVQHRPDSSHISQEFDPVWLQPTARLGDMFDILNHYATRLIRPSRCSCLDTRNTGDHLDRVGPNGGHTRVVSGSGISVLARTAKAARPVVGSSCELPCRTCRPIPRADSEFVHQSPSSTRICFRTAILLQHSRNRRVEPESIPCSPCAVANQKQWRRYGRTRRSPCGWALRFGRP